MSTPEDPDLESFLEQFRPRSPAALPRPHQRRRVGRWWLAAAAAVVAATALWQWAPPSRVTPQSSPSPSDPGVAVRPGAVRLALVSTGSHESVLDEVNLRALPDPTRPGGALRVLGNVSRDIHEPETGRTP